MTRSQPVLVLKYDDQRAVAPQANVLEADPARFLEMLDLMDNERYTSIVLEAVISDAATRLAVHGSERVGFVCSFSSVSHDGSDVQELWMTRPVAENHAGSGLEARIRVFGATTMFPSEWVVDRDAVVRAAEVFIRERVPDPSASWQRTI